MVRNSESTLGRIKLIFIWSVTAHIIFFDARQSDLLQKDYKVISKFVPVDQDWVVSQLNMTNVKNLLHQYLYQ